MHTIMQTSMQTSKLKSLLKTLLSLLLLLPGLAAAQGAITAVFENPTGFLKPGSSVDLRVRITNPADSNFTIHGRSGQGSSHDVAPPMAWAANHRIVQDAQNCVLVIDSFCMVSGTLPILPGESAVIGFQSIRVPEQLPVGSAISVGPAHVQLRGKSNDSRRIWIRNNAVYIVSASGTGDPAAFAGQGYIEAYPPYAPPQVAMDFHYPAELQAGEPFHLTATITNTGPTVLEQIHWIPFSPFQTISGAHSTSFDEIRCERSCILAGQFPLAPGESLLQDFSTFHYRAETLSAGTLHLTRPTALGHDAYERLDDLTVASSGVTINILGPVVGTVGGTVVGTAVSIPNPGFGDPDPLPVVPVNPHNSGDQQLLRDHNSNRDWLRLAATEGMSKQELAQALAPGGLYAGFKLATAAQVEAMLLNYARSKGLRLLPHQLNIYSEDLNSTLKELMQFMGSTGEQTSVMYSSSVSGGPLTLSSYHMSHAGIVSDPVVGATTSISNSVVVPVFHLITSSLWQSSKQVIERTTLPRYVTPTPPLYWLYRSGAPMPGVDPQQARYVDDVLELPSISIGENKVAARLKFWNPIGGLLQLVEVKDAEPDTVASAGEFNPITGELLLPEVVVEMDGQPTLNFRILLQYVHGSSEALFKLEEVQLLP